MVVDELDGIRLHLCFRNVSMPIIRTRQCLEESLDAFMSHEGILASRKNYGYGIDIRRYGRTVE